MKNIDEIIEDILVKVKTPTPPLPDFEDPAICKEYFEARNSSKRVYYTPLVIKWFRFLENELYTFHGLEPEEQYWDLNLDYLVNLINKIKNEESKSYFERLYNEFFQIAKKVPLERFKIKEEKKYY